MTIPLVLLAAGAAVLGLAIGLPPDKGWIHDFLHPMFSVPGEAAEAAVSNTMTLVFGAISTVIALGGVWIAYQAYVVKSAIFDPEAWAAKLKPAYQLAFNKWYFDEIYEALIIHPAYLFSVFLWQIVDVRVIDGAVNGVATTVGFSASRMRRVQTGFVANYALAIAIGAVVIIGAYFAFDSTLF
jgi:NADH-quinone oxidoreductase subunit L